MQYWEHGVALPDTVEGNVTLRNVGRFARRNRFRLVAAAVAALAVGAAALPATAGTPTGGVPAFPTAEFEDPVFEAAADAFAAAGAEAAPEAPGAPGTAPVGNADQDSGNGAAPTPGAPATSAPSGPATGDDGGWSEVPLPALGAEAIDFSVRLTPTEVGADGAFLAELVAVNTGDRTARATVSSVDFTVSGPEGVLYSGNYRIGFPITVEAGEETSIGVTVDPYTLSWLADDLPDVIAAGTYSGPVTINVQGAAPVTHSVSLTYTEDIDLAAWATERCQAMIDGWGDGFVEYSGTATGSGVVAVDGVVAVGSEEYSPPTLEECLGWYGF